MKTLGMVGVLGVLGVMGCGGGKAVDPRFPPQPEGCNVQLYPDAPTIPTENLGTVSSSCDDSVSEKDCLRQLKDEVCKIGGDVAWGVPNKPQVKNGKNYWSARAAHTKPVK